MNIIESAIIFATKAHEGQVRKFTQVPYILHPLNVLHSLIDHCIYRLWEQKTPPLDFTGFFDSKDREELILLLEGKENTQGGSVIFREL